MITVLNPLHRRNTRCNFEKVANRLAFAMLPGLGRSRETFASWVASTTVLDNVAQKRPVLFSKNGAFFMSLVELKGEATAESTRR